MEVQTTNGSSSSERHQGWCQFPQLEQQILRQQFEQACQSWTQQKIEKMLLV